MHYSCIREWNCTATCKRATVATKVGHPVKAARERCKSGDEWIIHVYSEISVIKLYRVSLVKSSAVRSVGKVDRHTHLGKVALKNFCSLSLCLFIRYRNEPLLITNLINWLLNLAFLDSSRSRNEIASCDVLWHIHD